MNFGEKLKAARLAAGLSQSGLARAANVSLSAVRDWEQRRRDPRLIHVARAAKALNVAMEELVPDEEKPAAKAKKKGRGR